MGKEERAEMYLQLEETVKELNQKMQEVTRIWNGLGTLSTFLIEKAGKAKFDPKAFSFIKDLVNLETIERLTDRILELRLRKQDLEKTLGITLTIEKPE